MISPWIAALHPVNALLLFWASFTVARGSGDAIARAEGAARRLPAPRGEVRTLRPEPA